MRRTLGRRSPARAFAYFPVLVLILLAVFAGCSRAELTDAAALQQLPLTIVTSAGAHHSYTVEVAMTGDEQSKGLMYRRSMPRDRGMIFPFAPPRNAYFWMANTYIPLDMIFVTADGKIESILVDVQPLTEDQRRSLGPVAAVLELNAGETSRIGAKPGDRVEYRLQDLPARPE